MAMLLEQSFLDALVAGRVDLTFRRWATMRVRVGTRIRTSHGLVEVLEIEEIARDEIGDADVERAGEPSLEALLARLDAREGAIFRIRLRRAGDDPRVALRVRVELDADELTQIRSQLEKLERRGPWTLEVLRMIADRPGVRAATLAQRLGRDLPPFKRDVRKLKDLGLTESLEIGYRLSPRGEAVLAALQPNDIATSSSDTAQATS